MNAEELDGLLEQLGTPANLDLDIVRKQLRGAQRQSADQHTVQLLLRLAAGRSDSVGAAAAELADALLALGDASRGSSEALAGHTALFCSMTSETLAPVFIAMGGSGDMIRLETTLLLPTLRSQAAKGATGAEVTPGILFPSSEILARVLLLPRCASIVRGRRVCEVGAGSHGLPSLAAAAAGAAEVVATERDAAALGLLRRNNQTAESLQSDLPASSHP